MMGIVPTDGSDVKEENPGCASPTKSPSLILNSRGAVEPLGLLTVHVADPKLTVTSSPVRVRVPF